MIKKAQLVTKSHDFCIVLRLYFLLLLFEKILFFATEFHLKQKVHIQNWFAFKYSFFYKKKGVHKW